MPTSEQRERLIDLQDRLIDSLVQQDEASQAGNWNRERELTKELAAARSRRDKISRSIAKDDPAKPGKEHRIEAEKACRDLA